MFSQCLFTRSIKAIGLILSNFSIKAVQNPDYAVGNNLTRNIINGNNRMAKNNKPKTLFMGLHVNESKFSAS
jgi:hypothetical protein